MSEWISVDQVLPQEEGEYLIWDGYWNIVLFIDGMWDFGRARMLTKDTDITHWMPLPEAPHE